jgi:hypothetical protein
MFSLILSPALLMSKLSSKLSQATNLFEISTWNFSLTSTSSSFFKSNLSKSEFCFARLFVLFTKCYYGDQIMEDGISGHVARMGEMRKTSFWSGKLKGRDGLEDVGVNDKMILEWILGR